MSRLSMVLVAVVAVSGCKNSGSSGSAADPFFGRTRVTPPATGTVAGPSGGMPYYGPQPAQPNPLRSPAAPGSGTAPPWTPPAVQPQQPLPSPAPQPQPNPSPTWLPPQTGPAPASPTGASSAIPQAALTGDRIAIPASATTDVAATPSLPAPQNTAATASATADVAKRPAGGSAPGPALAAAAGPLSASGAQLAGPVYGPTQAGTLATRERIERTLQPRVVGSENYLRNAPGPLDPALQSSPPPQPNQTRGPVNLTDLPEVPPSAS
jgi:hypothetical protein